MGLLTGAVLIVKNLQPAIDKIIDFCKTWDFAINVSKTCYTTFTTAGQRKNYHKNYKLKLTVLDSEIPLDANPTFLGIKLDPKLSFKPHLQDLENKLTSKTSLMNF
ncbi:Pol [Brachionus plicatilis]|uniref:Pol n=1 Tax=Brachionus plicatilis TaxID=10195 RepID=A0A3M7R781_BRAPC|nr:Pol [Brachionus plicatilis]